jgi:hypothetical protein
MLLSSKLPVPMAVTIAGVQALCFCKDFNLGFGIILKNKSNVKYKLIYQTYIKVMQTSYTPVFSRYRLIFLVVVLANSVSRIFISMTLLYIGMFLLMLFISAFINL